eukprot:scaffold135_cov249-Pinguiococcus_pyrenoidosus.AAC.23
MRAHLARLRIERGPSVIWRWALAGRGRFGLPSVRIAGGMHGRSGMHRRSAKTGFRWGEEGACVQARRCTRHGASRDTHGASRDTALDCTGPRARLDIPGLVAGCVGTEGRSKRRAENEVASRMRVDDMHAFWLAALLVASASAWLCAPLVWPSGACRGNLHGLITCRGRIQSARCTFAISDERRRGSYRFSNEFERIQQIEEISGPTIPSSSLSGLPTGLRHRCLP